MKLCIAPNHLLWNTTLGGHAWVFLNWALGLQELGCEIVLLEPLKREVEPQELDKRVSAFLSDLAALGLEARLCLASEEELGGKLVPLARVREESELFLNFRYLMPEGIVRGFARSALVDIDPGLLQMWIHQGQMRPCEHDLYVTIGETVGRAGSRIPGCGLDWIHTPPPVHLPSWPVAPPVEGAPWTTVTNWWGEYEVLAGETINNEKRTNFIEYLNLPALTTVPLELAIYHEPGHPSEMPLLREHGWRARPAREVSATPQRYRDYIRGSRGEFSCAKQSCMFLENAWVSDRTLCYLASGRPAVVQHTGASALLPDGEGLLRFRSKEEAARLLERAEADYDHHSRAARALVEERFAAGKVLGRLLERVLPKEKGIRRAPG